MARSSYIYTVTPFAGSGFPAAVFTVKHEMVTWIKRNYPWEPGKCERPIRVHRFPDGGHPVFDENGVNVHRTELDVKKLMGED